MSSVQTQSRYDASRHMNFISTAPYHTVFFTYTQVAAAASNSFVGYGYLSPVQKTGGGNVTAAECPAGRILRATNKKIYPDAAGIPTTGVYALADRTPLVGVFDYSTGLSGFIDPNQTVFAIYNVDKPVDATDEESSTGRNTHKGVSVYTGGVVYAVGDITSTTGNIAATAGSVSAGTTVTAGTGLTVTSGGLTITAGGLTITAGRLTVPATIAGTATLVAGTVAITVSGVTTSSRAFVTLATPNTGSSTVKFQAVCTANTVTITALVAAGTINTADISVVNYFVVN